MTTSLSRTGDIISLDDFNRELLGSMLGEDVPTSLLVGQARLLVSRVRVISGKGMQYGAILNGFLSDLEELLGDGDGRKA